MKDFTVTEELWLRYLFIGVQDTKGPEFKKGSIALQMTFMDIRPAEEEPAPMIAF